MQTVRRRGHLIEIATLLVAAAFAVLSLLTLGGSSPAGRQQPPRAAIPSPTARVPAPKRARSESKRGHAAPTAEPSESIPRMIGQMIIARFSGSTPSASLLTRIRAGQVGGVILFADNFAEGSNATRATVSELQHTARRGGNPPLLVMTDQEGGQVKRVSGPPTLAPSEMTPPEVGFAQGRATGALLRSLGVNIDLAPVADVERVPGSFLGTRTFGSTSSEVAANACAFARGVASQHVAYTLKHFPGLGRAVQSTDVAPQSILGPANDLRSDYGAYRACAENPLALVMISSAIYPDLTGPLPAVMSPVTYQRELPIGTGGAAVLTISDDLQAAALRKQQDTARRAINAGLDLLMYAGTEQASADAYASLLDDARSGLVSTSRIRVAFGAIETLKRHTARTSSSVIHRGD